MIKLKLHEKNKLSSAVLLILLILIILGVLGFMIFGLRHLNLLELPEFIENILSGREKTMVQTETDDRHIYDFLRIFANDAEETETEDNELYVFNITLENIREVIGNIILPDNIYIESTAKYYNKNNPENPVKAIETSLWKKGGKFRYLVKSNYGNELLYINDGEREYIYDYISGSRITKNADKKFSFSNIPNIQDINYYLDLIESIEYTKIVNYSPVQTNDNENVARIKYEIPALNQYEHIFVSLDTGIVLEVRSDYGSDTTLYYEYTATVKEAYNDGADISRTDIVDRLFVIN